MKLEDFLKQAVSDILSILTLIPSTKTSRLSAGDPARSDLVTLVIQINRIEPISIQAAKGTTSLPRVETPISYNNPPHPAAVLRVDKASSSTKTTETILHIHSKELKISISTIVMSTENHYDQKSEI